MSDMVKCVVVMFSDDAQKGPEAYRLERLEIPAIRRGDLFGYAYDQLAQLDLRIAACMEEEEAGHVLPLIEKHAKSVRRQRLGNTLRCAAVVRYGRRPVDHPRAYALKIFKATKGSEDEIFPDAVIRYGRDERYVRLSVEEVALPAVIGLFKNRTLGMRSPPEARAA